MDQTERGTDNSEYKKENIKTVVGENDISEEQANKKGAANHVLALDIETSGSSFTDNGILSIGASLQDSDSNEIDFFQINILLDQVSYDKECKEKFWDKHPQAKEFIETNALHPKDAMKKFSSFLSKIDAQYPNVTIISDNPNFDIPWIDYYLKKYLNAKPLRYSSVDNSYRMVWDSVSVQKTLLCLKSPELSFYDQPHGHREKLGLYSNYPHDHNPLNDARRIAEHYNQAIRKLEQLREEIPIKKAPKNIVLTKYDSRWKESFLFEKHKIEDAFKKGGNQDNLLHILHVGSTSVPGLVAKPIIDIIVVVKNSDALDDVFYQAGYSYKGEYNIPMRKMYGSNEAYEVYVHAYEEGNPEIGLNIMFRDYLNMHADARETYAQLKKVILEKDKSHSKVASTGITTYNLEKNDFIQSILVKAGFVGLCMRLCAQNMEWEAYHKIRNSYLSKIPTLREININDSNQKHIVLHFGTKVVAAAQLQLSPPNAFLEFSGFSDEVLLEDGKRFQSHLLKNIEKWIKKLNIIFLTTSVSCDDVFTYATNSYEVLDNKKQVVHMLKYLLDPDSAVELPQAIQSNFKQYADQGTEKKTAETMSYTTIPDSFPQLAQQMVGMEEDRPAPTMLVTLKEPTAVRTCFVPRTTENLS